MKDIHTLAMEYAIVARDGYESGSFLGDQTEVQLLHIKKEMTNRFDHYTVQEAIKQAHETAKMFNIHPEQE